MKLRSSYCIVKKPLIGDPPLSCLLMGIIIFVLGCFSVEMMATK